MEENCNTCLHDPVLCGEYPSRCRCYEEGSRSSSSTSSTRTCARYSSKWNAPKDDKGFFKKEDFDV